MLFITPAESFDRLKIAENDFSSIDTDKIEKYVYCNLLRTCTRMKYFLNDFLNDTEFHEIQLFSQC